ncbi:hypothetical protein AO373_1278 [Moraxella catarrhalis]|uniref:Uncharacterized protein n=1 Tax=Moraxella catarrhalis TaxID=480 RepID=A0AB36DNZ5_MORCA|nr:hypothetical protein AO379_1701 [Moraxella catarrhalis]OAV09734.1 hypothetical protein AO378_0852 [Moraxella catarrhalis]OAV18041.1 hypothetical protein AO373_1278 [Moraxella catarrhalis]OAV25472.1 hypothetical protein AO370_0942 [Moraxella catarrhalis]RUO13700.1 hypothetical protein EJK49_0799 [Moraxella catarrhalis]
MGGCRFGFAGVVLVLGKWQAWRLLSKWADLWRFILFDKMLF